MTLYPKIAFDSSDIGGSLRDMTAATNGLTARAGGGQALGTPISTTMARFTVVATAADSALLPPGIAGARCTIYNNAANAMNVFPSTGQSINALAVNTAFSLPAAKACQFICFVNGTWNTLLGA